MYKLLLLLICDLAFIKRLTTISAVQYQPKFGIPILLLNHHNIVKVLSIKRKMVKLAIMQSVSYKLVCKNITCNMLPFSRCMHTIHL